MLFFLEFDTALVAVTAILAGVAILMVLRAMNDWQPLEVGDLWPWRWRRLRRVRVGDVLRLLWTIALWVLVGFIVLLALGWVILVWPSDVSQRDPVAVVLFALRGVTIAIATVILGVLVFQRYRTARQRALLSTLAVAAERGIPFPPVLRALVAERHGSVARRTRQAAAYLESGATLPDALATSRGLVPRQALFKIRLGQDVGALPQALREAGLADVAADSTRAQLNTKLAYIVVLGLFLLQVVIFVAFKIMPSFEHIFKDFYTSLPPVTKFLIAADHVVLQFGWLFLLAIFVLLLYVLAWSLAGFEANYPILRRLTTRLDRAAILESLALATERQRPMTEGILALAMHYPKGWVRRRLDRAFTAIRAGANWTDSLLAQRLVRPADAAILRAAQHAGNLPWALREVAESNRRRFNYRVYVLLQWLFPLVILLVGSIVALFVAACFTPLVSLIQRMAG